MSDYLVEINDPPHGLHSEYQVIFTAEALEFLAELFTTFEARIDQLYYDRSKRKENLRASKELPKFLNTKQRLDRSWRIKPVPKRLEDRRLDLGDVSPANSQHFFEALNAEVQGIQVDFDDGHCPAWKNQVLGHYNIYTVVHGKKLSELPILMLRPRAWNMIEHNIMINGKKSPGALVDFAMLMYHNARILYEENAGPCFYLSKLESATEAKLWNDIFLWTQNRLGIPRGTIKACVLIENILASFEMEEMLYELKEHSLGLNCGIWDYAASIIGKFGHRKEFMLPDRNKYVNMQRHFLKKYMQLVVQVCHKRGAHATGGMAAQTLYKKDDEETIDKVVNAKRFEVENGVDGFMVYDLKLVKYMNQLWTKTCPNRVNQLEFINDQVVYESDLLKMPSGGVTFIGLVHNVEVSILFVYNWLIGKGHFINKNAVEDSATAEISRSQIWQWLTHMAKIEETNQIVTFKLICNITEEFVKKSTNVNREILIKAVNIFLQIVTSPNPPDFITSYLNDYYINQLFVNSKY